MLLALGYDKSEASESLRITLGPENTEAEVDGAIAAVRESVSRLRTEVVPRAPRMEGRVSPVPGEEF